MYIVCNEFYDPDVENVYEANYDEFTCVKDIESNIFVFDTEDNMLESISVKDLYSLWVEKAIEEHYNKLQTIDFDTFWLHTGMRVSSIVNYDVASYLFYNKRDYSFYDLDLIDAMNLGYSRMKWSKLPQFALKNNRVALDKAHTGNLRLSDVGLISGYTVTGINKMSIPYVYTAYDIIVSIFDVQKAQKFMVTGMGYYKSKLFIVQRQQKIGKVWYIVNTYVDTTSLAIVYFELYVHKPNDKIRLIHKGDEFSVAKSRAKLKLFGVGDFLV